LKQLVSRTAKEAHSNRVCQVRHWPPSCGASLVAAARRAARLITASRAGAGRFPRARAATALARPDELKAAGKRRLAASTAAADSRGDAIITAIEAPDPPLIALAAKAADNAEVRRALGESRMTPLRASLAG
jgi:hypothetical protein